MQDCSTIRRKLTPDGVVRLEAAHQQYVDALRAVNRLRSGRRRYKQQTDADYTMILGDAYRRMRDALAQWIAIYEQETGTKLAEDNESR